MSIDFAPSSAGQPPMHTMSISPTLTSSSRTTIAFVAFDDAFSRFGRSRTTPGSRSASAIPWRMIRVGGVACDAPHAGVVELADTPALGAGGASRGGSSPSARIRRVRFIKRLTLVRSRCMTQPGRVLAVVSSAVFMASLDLFVVNIAFPDLARDFPDTSLAGLSWVLNGYAIVFASLLVPAGRFADRVGRKRCFLAGLGLFVAASAACAAAPSVELLVASRVVQAVGAAVLMPTSLALLLAETPAERRAAAIGVWAAMGGIAAAAGPPIGGPPRRAPG